MNEQTKPRSKTFLFLYWIMILILMTLMVTATYTWFTISRTPRVSNIGLYINAPTGMVISPSPDGGWGHRLDFSELVPQTSPLRPVTWSEEEQCFYAAQYGADGRQTGQWIKLSDRINANRDDVYGYYIKITFYATTDTDVQVKLTEAMAVEEGVDGTGTYLIGTPVWDSENILHSDGGSGAQNAMRIGLRITPMSDGVEQNDQSVFYIYEPNADTHIDGTEGYVSTPSIDGGESLVPSDRLITQTTTTWTEADIVQRDVVVKDMGQFTSPTDVFQLDAMQIVKIDMYVWLEGQDVDCDNRIGHEAQIMANVQFFADPSGQSGLEPIPDDEE